MLHEMRVVEFKRVGGVLSAVAVTAVLPVIVTVTLALVEEVEQLGVRVGDLDLLSDLAQRRLAAQVFSIELREVDRNVDDLLRCVLLLLDHVLRLLRLSRLLL